MTRTATCSLGLIVLLAAAHALQAQTPAPMDTAIAEAVRRQALTLEMRQKLAEAQRAHSSGGFPAAILLYEDALKKADAVGPDVEAERVVVVAGLTGVRLELAQQAQHRNDLREADYQVQAALRADPKNPAVLQFKALNDKLLAQQAGRIPSPAAVARIAEVHTNKVQAAEHAQNGRLFYELGKYDDAIVELEKAIAIDPENRVAFYYLNLIPQAQHAVASTKAEVVSKQSMVKVVQAWDAPVDRELLPTPNPYARSEQIHTGKGRQTILSKLDRIRLNEVKYPGIELGDVIRNLGEETRRRDPDKTGINFMILSETAAPTAPPGPPDPTTGLPPPAAAEALDLSTARVKLDPPLTDIRLADVLDAIVKTTDRPIKYSIEDYAVIFSAKTQVPELYTRSFKVDPNTFVQGLAGVTASSFGVSGGGGGGFGGGGGGGLGGGGGSFGGGGGSFGGGGGSFGGGGGSFGGGGGGGGGGGTTIAAVNVAGGGGGGGGAAAGGPGGAGGGGGGGGGLEFITSRTSVDAISTAVRNFFTTAGVDLAAPKAVFWNDRQGILLVRATLQDLDIIETAIQALNVAPPLINIRSKFIELSQNDSRSLGFDWYLGNVLMNNGAIGGQAGTAPSFTGVPTAANPLGVFPGNVASATTTAPGAGDTLLTGGLRNTGPTLATFTGILTDPQFRLVIRALEQRDGADILSDIEATTLSGRQTQMRATDLRTIVIDISYNQGGGGGIGTFGTGAGTGTGTGASDRNLKNNFASVDTREVLAKVASLPITTWNYRADTATRHLGPMAQDFHAAFGIGTDDKTIGFLDEGGVALAAIQGLNQKVEDKAAKIKALEKELSELKALVQTLVTNSNGGSGAGGR